METSPGDESNAVVESRDEDGVEYEVSSDERTWAILAHAMGFVGLAIPLGNILGPLLVWAIKKEEGDFVDENGKQATNFQISWTILLVVAGLTIFVGIGVILFPLVGLVWLALTGLAVVRTSNNQVYDYPLTYEFIS